MICLFCKDLSFLGLGVERGCGEEGQRTGPGKGGFLGADPSEA